MPLPALSVRCPRCHSGQFVAAEAAHLPQRCAVCSHIFTLGAPVISAPAAPLPPHLRQAKFAPPHAPVQPPADDIAEDKPKPSRLKGLILRTALLAILLSIAAMIAMLPQLVRKLQPKSLRPVGEAADVEVVEIIDARPASNGPVEWIDATRSSGSRAGIQVKVLRCEYAEVLARDNNNVPVPAGPGEFLQIFLQITNRTSNEVQYTSWYGNHFRSDKEPIAAVLTDDTNRRYPPQRFTGVKDIGGNLPQAKLSPGESVRDVLIFAIPRAKGTGEETLFLQLPAAAVRRPGSFDFQLSAELWQR